MILNHSNTFLYSLVPSSWATSEITNTTNGSALHEQIYVLVCTVRLTTGLRIAPTVNWYYNGSIVEKSERVMVKTRYSYYNSATTHTLTFLPVFNHDGGVYSCRAHAGRCTLDDHSTTGQAS